MADEVFKRDENYVPTVGGVSESAGEIVQFKFDDTTERALVDATTEEQGHGSVGDGVLSLTTAFTSAQVSASSVSCKRVWVQAHPNNPDMVVVGSSFIYASTNSIRGKILYATQGDWITVSTSTCYLE